eukprot:gene12476-14638_t
MTEKEKVLRILAIVAEDDTQVTKDLCIKFNVSPSMVSREKKLQNQSVNRRYLSEEQEEQLENQVDAAFMKGLPLSKDMVLSMARDIHYGVESAPNEELPGNGYWKGLVKRRPEIKLRSIKYLDKKRKLAQATDKAGEFLDTIHQTIETNGIPKSNIFNYDESGIKFNMVKKKGVIVVRAGMDKKETQKPTLDKQVQSQHFTIVPIISADGRSYPFFSILQDPKKKQVQYNFGKHKHPLVMNETGYLDFAKFMIKEVEKVIPKTEKKLIIFDNHSSNETKELRDLFEEAGYILQPLPSNLTHVLQPLDLVLFSSFKAKLDKVILDVVSWHATKGKSYTLNPEHFPLMCQRAYEESFVPHNVRVAWEKSGIPYQKTRLRSLESVPLAETENARVKTLKQFSKQVASQPTNILQISIQNNQQNVYNECNVLNTNTPVAVPNLRAIEQDQQKKKRNSPTIHTTSTSFSGSFIFVDQTSNY